MMLHVLMFNSFLLLTSILLYEFTVIRLYIKYYYYLQFLATMNNAYIKFLHRFFCGQMLSFSLGYIIWS